MKVCITVDMEHDCPPYLTTYRGVEEGTPRLLSLFAQEQVPATFFTTGDVARRYPETVRSIVSGGHELGCHGDSHRRFSQLDEDAARQELKDAGATLRQFYPVISFRAPNLDFPRRYLPLLHEAGYRLDSSEGRHKPGSLFVKPSVQGAVARVPASIAPSALRLPGVVRRLLLSRMDSPAVFFVHPWEFVDVTAAPIPWDCRFLTGDPALLSLRETIRYFKARRAEFHKMGELC